MKKQTKQTKRRTDVTLRRKIGVSAGIAVLIIAVVLVASKGYILHANAVRKARIEAIYSGLNLPYYPGTSDVFGDKRPYDWGGDAGKGRSYSSVQTYEVGKTVSATVDEFQTAIEREGFRYIGDPYPGSADVQKHYESAKGEFVRLTVSSKPRDDAFRDAGLLGQPTTNALTLDPNAAPSNVTLKVNLDDNNE